jgi:predicted metalloprotease with PDZ domain
VSWEDTIDPLDRQRGDTARRYREVSMRIFMAMGLCSLCLFLDQSAAQSECRPAPPSTERSLELKGAPVAYVDRVEPRSSAEKAGLSPGDLILGFNSQDLRAFSGYESCMAELRLAAISDKVVIDILKYMEFSDSYRPSVVILTLAGSNERYAGFSSHFAYVITAITTGGLADRLGARPGDFLEKAGGLRIGTLRGPVELDQIVSDATVKSRGKVELSLSRWHPMKDGTIRGETREVEIAP